MASRKNAGAPTPAGKKLRVSPLVGRFAKLGLVFQPDVPVKDYTTAEQRKQLKALAFSEIGARRLKQARRALKGIGQLANSSSYSYTPEQIDKIGNLLADELQSTMLRFAKGAAAEVDDITL